MSLTVSICPSVTGTESSYVTFEVSDAGTPENIRIEKNISSNSFCLDFNQDSFRSLNSLFYLEKMNFSFLPKKEKYVNLAKSLNIDLSKEMPLWSSIMSSDDYKTFLENLVFDVAKTIHQSKKEYFLGPWTSTSHVFDDLREPTVSVLEINKRWDKLKHLFTSVKIDKFGNCQKVIYDRLSSRTGRLKVKSGPSVLTFPKDSRDLFISKYKNGSILSVDFISLEARVALCFSELEHENEDVYEDLNQKFFKGVLPRNIIKLATLSLLFGMGAKSLSEEIGCSEDSAYKFIERMKKIFCIESVTKNLKNELELEGSIRNFYKRKILIENSAEHILYNSFIQSTAVDVVLLGISQMLKQLDNDVRPLFIIHDEIYLDCPIEKFQHLKKISSNIKVNLNGRNVLFPTKIKLISKTW